MFELISYITVFVMGWITKWAWDGRYREPATSSPVDANEWREDVTEPVSEFPNYKYVSWK